MNTQTLAQKRQRFHRLLIALGEDKYKDVIVSARFDVDSTTALSERQLDELIADAVHRLYQRRNPANIDDKAVRGWRNRCLLVLAQRGITATASDWSRINEELSRKHYQWVMTPQQVEKGLINYKGLYAFNTVDDLKKLFNQLSSIRDNEARKAQQLRELAKRN
ncbi:MAG: hypothetical protein ACK5JD_11030 [Mangrovibacterium sp.]